MSGTPTPQFDSKRRIKAFFVGLFPPLLLLAGLLGILIYTLQSQFKSDEYFEENALQEWLKETRIGQSNLTELVRDYFSLPNSAAPSELENKLDAIQTHIETVGDLTRKYQQQLPLFVSAFRIEMEFTPPAPRKISWEAGFPAPAGVHVMTVQLYDKDQKSAHLIISSQMRAFADRQEEQHRKQVRLRQWLSLVTVGATLLAFAWGWLFLRSERRREIQDYEKKLALDQKEKERLEEKLKREEVELGLAEARTKLYADINILAGAYAHNIKNLLVRPRELLRRCSGESDVPTGTRTLLQEAHEHLQAVTERAQQILKTVRRDVDKPQLQEIDLVSLVKSVIKTWQETAENQWKLDLTLECDEPRLLMHGDHSLLVQTLENLIFNSRDSTYAQRNILREQARSEPDLRKRKEAILEATSWRGRAGVRLRKSDGCVLLEVCDNGIGMTEEVKARCMETHFTTKRNNAIHEGDGTGMGLGLAFVKWALDNHKARIDIVSQPHQGATMRLWFPIS